MMSSNENSPVAGFGARQIATDMEEALDYLIGIALAAGLVDIARKLNDANADLVAVQLGNSVSNSKKGAADGVKNQRRHSWNNGGPYTDGPDFRRVSRQ